MAVGYSGDDESFNRAARALEDASARLDGAVQPRDDGADRDLIQLVSGLRAEAQARRRQQMLGAAAQASWEAKARADAQDVISRLPMAAAPAARPAPPPMAKAAPQWKTYAIGGAIGVGIAAAIALAISALRKKGK